MLYVVDCECCYSCCMLCKCFAAVECGKTQINKQTTNFLKYNNNMYIILKKHITSMFIQTHNPEKSKIIIM